MKKYILDVACCFSCPAYEYDRDDDIHWCTELDDKLDPDQHTIDPICPLEDK